MQRIPTQVHLYVNFYTDSNTNRQVELEYCLKKNAALNIVTEYHLIVDDVSQFQKWVGHFPKIRWHAHAKRPTFADMFQIANVTSGTTDCINIVANTDIVFDESLGLLVAKPQIFNNTVLCVSRDDNQTRGSQDAWIWKGTLNIPKQCNFFLGKMHCDHVLAYRLAQQGYRVANPCLSLRCRHVHKSEVRNYTSRDSVRGPRATVQPCTLRDVETNNLILLRWMPQRATVWRKNEVWMVITISVISLLIILSTHANTPRSRTS